MYTLCKEKNLIICGEVDFLNVTTHREYAAPITEDKVIEQTKRSIKMKASAPLKMVRSRKGSYRLTFV